MERPGQEDITKQLTLRRCGPTLDSMEAKTLYPVDETSADEYSVLGRAFGSELGCALLMAYKYCPNFFERAAAYRLVKDPIQKAFAGKPALKQSIEFLERKV
jgi:hypothetical protein